MLDIFLTEIRVVRLKVSATIGEGSTKQSGRDGQWYPRERLVIRRLGREREENAYLDSVE